ncbi:hypothetical protein ABGB18_13115 [Nonomuraea sp. B12E4]|uniref:hypothetical protein n=1 Tax=Nonomuraea sp. B12E4 TaxID=3153564 RepID=UPI00325C67DA
MRFTRNGVLTGSAAIVITAGFSVGLESAATAAALYAKTGTHVSHSYVFSSGNSGNMRCWGQTTDIPDAEMCYRADRNATYVQSTKANGYFKLGQHGSGGNTWRCRNNYTSSAGTGTWVECKWSTKPGSADCSTIRVGHGQSDWYVLSRASSLMCF